MTTLNSGLKKKVFLSSGTFEVPEGVTNVYVLGCGGGGGGGASNYHNGGPGGSGAVPSYVPFEVTPGARIAVTIGAGGAPGLSISAEGGNGGNSSFASLTFYGGEGGKIVEVVDEDGQISLRTVAGGSGAGIFSKGGLGAIYGDNQGSGNPFAPAPGHGSNFAQGGAAPKYGAQDFLTVSGAGWVAYFGGGGGGGAGFGPGGGGGPVNGATFVTSRPWDTTFIQGLPALEGGIGGGGGGGPAAGTANNYTRFYPGAAGGPGMIVVYWGEK